jgi:hypothetical protein
MSVPSERALCQSVGLDRRAELKLSKIRLWNEKTVDFQKERSLFLPWGGGSYLLKLTIKKGE